MARGIWNAHAGDRLGLASALAALLGLGFLSAPVAAAMAATARVTGFVAVTDGSGSMQISSFDLAGGHEKRLTSGPANHHYPSLSSDGRDLLYVGDDEGRDEIYRLSLAGTVAAPEEVTAAPLFAESPAWAPDGRTIAYSGLLTGWRWYQIFVARSDGNRPVEVTHDTDAGSSQPVFSPDGKHIAFIKGRPGQNRIWVMNADGGAATPLTDGPLDAYPAWLDNRTVLFAREDPSAHRSSVLAVSMAGGSPLTISPPSISVVEPRPMPNGRSYGATARVGDALHLVVIARADGMPMTAPGNSEFVVRPIGVGSQDGSVFTMSWIVDQPAAPQGSAGSISPFLIAAIGAAIVFAGAVAGYRAFFTKTSVC
jgi:dipeptidyl aminopeptidase/acylaminoacyl peptidase